MFEHVRLHAPQRRLVIWVEPLRSREIQVKIVERRRFDRGREGFEDAPHALGIIRVMLVLPRHNDGSRANAQRLAKRHRGFYAAGFRFIARRCHDAAPHEHGLAAQLWIQHLLDGSEKRVHVHVDNVRNRSTARRIGAAAFFFARVFVKRIEGHRHCGKYIFNADVHNGSYES